MLDFIRRALTRTTKTRTLPSSRGRRKPKQSGAHSLPPRESLVYGVALALAFFGGLTALQALHLIINRTISSEISAGQMLVIGTVLGAFFGARA